MVRLCCRQEQALRRSRRTSAPQAHRCRGNQLPQPRCTKPPIGAVFSWICKYCAKFDYEQVSQTQCWRTVRSAAQAKGRANVWIKRLLISADFRTILIKNALIFWRFYDIILWNLMRRFDAVFLFLPCASRRDFYLTKRPNMKMPNFLRTLMTSPAYMDKNSAEYATAEQYLKYCIREMSQRMHLVV